jgi:hypothetical protein
MDSLEAEVRAWTTPTPKDSESTRKRKPTRKRANSQPRRPWPRIQYALIPDTETTMDAAQSLRFGVARLVGFEDGTAHTLIECLFYADDLPETDPEGYAALRQHALDRPADVSTTWTGSMLTNPRIMFGSRAEFVDKMIYRLCLPENRKCLPWSTDHRDAATLVGFNLAFDLSRIAVHVGEARGGIFGGGFSLQLVAGPDGGDVRNRPRVRVKQLNTKASFIEFSNRARIKPGDSPGLKRWKRESGRFLDLRTAVWAYTNRNVSLGYAAQLYKLATPKGEANFAGPIDDAFIDYARQDVKVTTELLEAVLREAERHPVNPCKAFSSAGVVKSYFDEMGIAGILKRQPDFDPDVLGAFTAAFYGGRAEVRVRRVPVPVRYADFTSMYPTVNALMGLWKLFTAKRVEAVDATEEVRTLLERVTLDECFNKALWPQLVGVALVEPDNDVLPIRAKFDPTVTNIAVQRIERSLTGPQWYSIGDLVASKILTGHAPLVLKAYGLRGVGQLPGMRPASFRGVEVDPNTDDLWVELVSQRAKVKQRTRGHLDGCICEDCRLSEFLKTMVNAGSYGIFSEMHRDDKPGSVEISTGGASWSKTVDTPEAPGRFCFMPFAASITGGCRLLLSMVERMVSDAGSVHVFCDTDSMAIPCSPNGREIDCDGGPIRTLTPDVVDAIQDRFNALNPYPAVAVAHVLKTEIGSRVVDAASTKRYAFVTEQTDGTYSVADEDNPVKAHALGHLRAPVDRKTTGRNWRREVWEYVVNGAMPDWADQPQLIDRHIGSFAQLRSFDDFNAGKAYRDQIKPFNFFIQARVDTFGVSPILNPSTARLIAPLGSALFINTDPDDYARYVLTTGRRDYVEYESVLVDGDGRPHVEGEPFPVGGVTAYYVSAMPMAEMLRTYGHHPEAKFNGPDGQPCNRETRGVLQRRSVVIASVEYIGKEAHNFEDGADLVATAAEREGLIVGLSLPLSEFDRLVRPFLRSRPDHLVSAATGVGLRTIERVAAGLTPCDRLRDKLTTYAGNAAVVELTSAGVPNRWIGRKSGLPFPTNEPHAALAMWNELLGGVRRCAGCAEPLTGRRKRYCTDACRQRAGRRGRAA